MAARAGGKPLRGAIGLDQAKPSYDAIIIGAGLGGATLALRLAQAGLSVLAVERGGFVDGGARAAGEPVGHYLYDLLSPEEELQAVGGLTKFYGAALYRLRESDFREVQHEAGVSPAWPISYAELAPFYDQAEALYRVHGAPDGDPSEPPRSCPYPHPPLPHDPLVAQVVRRLQGTGVQVAAIPRGLDYGEGRPCVLCSTCDVHLCRLDAKMDAEIAAIRPALKTGKLDLLINATCARVELNGRSISGVRIVQGGERVIAAPVVAVCAGQKGSVELLRRSRTGAFPEGLGNGGGVLGRYLAGHTTGVMFPLVSINPIGARHTKTFAINSNYEPGADWPYPMGVLQVAGQIPFWRDAGRFKRLLVKAVADRSLMCFAMTEALPTRESGFRFNGDCVSSETPPLTNEKTFARLKRVSAAMFLRAGYPVVPAMRAPQLWHKTGGAVMGNDPTHSVTDAHCQVHDVKGLYVVDASVLPSAGAVNTGLTIVALALRAGDRIAGLGTA
ncbi:MAG: GMC family oxidoreductase [Hyphomonadaceae bacterium]|nr:GMC family oxidoreductase [Hyphomonadaceae bacterium]